MLREASSKLEVFQATDGSLLLGRELGDLLDDVMGESPGDDRMSRRVTRLK